jgi:hypothetical protein
MGTTPQHLSRNFLCISFVQSNGKMPHAGNGQLGNLSEHKHAGNGQLGNLSEHKTNKEKVQITPYKYRESQDNP